MKLYIRILSFCKPYKLMIFVSIFSSLLFALFNAITIWLVGSLITSIMSPGSNKMADDNSFFANFQQFLNPAGTSQNSLEALKMLCFMLY